jgi:predicted amidophosphoribosyltransferase
MRPGSFQARAGAAKSLFIPADGLAFAAKYAEPQCGRCGSPASRASARHCTRCGAALLAVVKSADQVRREELHARMVAEPNPEW